MGAPNLNELSPITGGSRLHQSKLRQFIVSARPSTPDRLNLSVNPEPGLPQLRSSEQGAKPPFIVVTSYTPRLRLAAKRAEQAKLVTGQGDVWHHTPFGCRGTPSGAIRLCEPENLRRVDCSLLNVECCFAKEPPFGGSSCLKKWCAYN